ncbi:MAG: hypothetical protein BWY28_02883 [bacterium ADurb.Bin236]|nr:MAG: hypothetical protein BWY28_02883 [bacterium ADurb.Bin236]
MASSIYQSQKSLHIRSYIFCAASFRSYDSISSDTSLTTDAARESIHLSFKSSFAEFSSEASIPGASGAIIRMNLAVFHNLLQNPAPILNLSADTFTSCPIEPRYRKVNLIASAPNSSMISIGSITLPELLLIFFPVSSLISPCMNTSPKGTSPPNFSPKNIILATQKKMMSNPVTRTDVG